MPLRSLATGKQRLGGAIDAEEREGLLLGMLRRTLSLLTAWPACAAIHVVSGDRRVLEVAASLGALAVAESTEGLNPAVAAGRDAARAAGAAAVLILPADLPLLDETSLGRLLDAADAALAAGAGRPLVVVAPSDARNGTNGLLLSPADVIEPCFGPQSFEAHVREAKAADATLLVVTDAGLGFDLDTPEELERLPADVIESLLELGRRATVARSA
ncbi:MAG: 2-phospho-L-lactate/phosphoenolpyruvate guanylyltransferase [Chloroflexota bacterium]|nr:2-phospho-L-lactate/phosphoenolpyruvate guanylyltransferase [Chloroflexota bacterium]